MLRPKRSAEHSFGLQQLVNDCTLVVESGYQKYGHPSSWHHAGYQANPLEYKTPTNMLQAWRHGTVFPQHSPQRVNSE